MAKEEVNYPLQAEEDAKDAVENFIDEIVGQIVEKGEASDDMNNDYDNGDSYHHENHTDKSYNLLEAATLLDQLSEHEETDYGLWEGVKDPRKAVEVQAAYTYGNAVYSEWTDQISTINENVKEVLEEFAEKKTEMEIHRDALAAVEGGEDWTEEKAEKLRGLEGGLRAFDRRVKRAIEDSVYSTIERKKRSRHGEGPREWSPKP